MKQYHIGMIGLGKMGLNLALNMQHQGVSVVGYDQMPEAVRTAVGEGLDAYNRWKEFWEALGENRALWLMVPAGPVVDLVLEEMAPMLREGDIVIDGGNSHFDETRRRHQELADRGIAYLDVGTSGGMEGARNGACMMVGGPEEAYRSLEEMFRKICVPEGLGYFGSSGSGHYVKMVHNGIEYGMLQAMAEGFEILEAAGMDLDLHQAARVWGHGSVIRGWLMDLMDQALEEDPGLEQIADRVDASGEGLWTVQEALRLGVPAPVITESLYARYRSQQTVSFGGKVVAALRRQFGGHRIYKKGS